MEKYVLEIRHLGSILRNYHYRSDTKLGPGIVAIIRIPRNCHSCTNILYFYWDSNIKEVVNPPKYGRLYNCKYSQILGCHNNWIIMNFVGDGTYEDNYEHIIQTILDGNVMNMSLIIMEDKYIAIDSYDSSCHGYNIIKFSLSPYILQEELSIDGQVTYSGEMVPEANYLFPININSYYYVLQKLNSLTNKFSKEKIIGNVKLIYHGLKDVLPQCLRCIPQNYYNSLSPIHIPMKEHDNIMDE